MSPPRLPGRPDHATFQHRAGLAARLTSALHLTAPPVAIAFWEARSPGRPAPAADQQLLLAEPNEHGRTGSVPAGCVFWVMGAHRQYVTREADHANCSVGSLTHGFRSLSEVAANDDVQTLFSAGWADEAGVLALPVVAKGTDTVAYAPLATASFTPEVVLVRLDARGLMTVKNAVPQLPVEGKPQCHIVAMAKNEQRVVASVGCALSRARTGMRVDEATCVFPAGALPALVPALEHHAALDSSLARYAGIDARRFT
jgi:uncharacterized protein (DUF169 family)